MSHNYCTKMAQETHRVAGDVFRYVSFAVSGKEGCLDVQSPYPCCRSLGAERAAAGLTGRGHSVIIHRRNDLDGINDVYKYINGVNRSF